MWNKVCEELRSLLEIFFGQAFGNEKKYHLIRREEVCYPFHLFFSLLLPGIKTWFRFTIGVFFGTLPSFFSLFNASFSCKKEDFRDSNVLNARGGFNGYVDIGGRE